MILEALEIEKVSYPHFCEFCNGGITVWYTIMELSTIVCSLDSESFLMISAPSFNYMGR